MSNIKGCENYRLPGTLLFLLLMLSRRAGTVLACTSSLTCDDASASQVGIYPVPSSSSYPLQKQRRTRVRVYYSTSVDITYFSRRTKSHPHTHIRVDTPLCSVLSANGIAESSVSSLGPQCGSDGSAWFLFKVLEKAGLT